MKENGEDVVAHVLSYAWFNIFHEVLIQVQRRWHVENRLLTLRMWYR